jgi:branched-chain amino acid transport system substrate-binding protein
MSMSKTLHTRRSLLQHGASAAAAALIAKPAIAQGTPIRIGQQIDVSAYQEVYGFAFNLSAKTAIDYINAHGGIAGRKVEYILEDTASDVPMAVRKFRRLVETHKCDFILGDVHSGIDLATIPVAKELKTIYVPQGESSAVTGAKSNRYVFRLRQHSAIQGKAVVDFALKTLGKKNFYFLITDYAYGQSFVSDLSPLVTAQGGKVLGKAAIPMNTDDMLPYLAAVPSDVDMLFSVFVGPDALRYMRQSHEIGLSNRVTRFAPWGMIDATSMSGIESAVEGMYFLSSSARNLDEVPPNLRPFVKEARALMGITDESTLKSNPKRLIASSYYLAPWESIFMYKQAVEKTGWAGAQDTPKLIEAMENFEGKGSFEFPMGDFKIRPQDHQAFQAIAIERVAKGKLTTVAQVPPDMAAVPPDVDVTKEAF